MGGKQRLVSLQEAATQAQVTRRTVERWVATGKLRAVESDIDRRVRLVALDDVERIVGHQAGTEGRSTSEERQDVASVATYQDVIDQALQLMYSYMHRTISQVTPAMFTSQTMEQLRAGPLGHDLARLATIAQGKARESQKRVLEAIDSIVQLLFWPAAADDYTVPRAFWDTELGRMLALAKYRVFEPDELVSIGNAAEMLGVTRPTVYRWLDDRTLNYVRDDITGQTLVVRRDIEHLRQVALSLKDQEEADGSSRREIEADRVSPVVSSEDE